MAHTDYNSLAAVIKVNCVRNDNTFNSQIETFVSQAEDRIYNGSGSQSDPLYSESLRVPELSVSETLTVTDGLMTIPTRCLGIRRISRPGDVAGLNYLAPDMFAARDASASTGQPRWYTVEGIDIRFTPGGYTGDMDILYNKRPDDVTPANQTNAILTNYPNLYLYATMAEALLWMQDPAAEQWIKRLASSIAGFSKTARESSYGGGTLRVQPRSVIGANA